MTAFDLLIVSALIEKDGKYLILKRSENNLTNKHMWQLPEGKVRPGEDMISALKRELLEETSMILTSAKLFGIHSNVSNESRGMVRVRRIVFKCRTMGKIKLSKDHEDFKWVSLKDRVDFIEGFDPKNIISVKKVKN